MNLIARWLAPFRVRKLLRQLGSESRDIAHTLYDMGVRGDSARDCPIAVYLKGQGFPVSVGFTCLCLIEDGFSQWRFVALPDACQRFVRDFDDGVYPALREERNT